MRKSNNRISLIFSFILTHLPRDSHTDSTTPFQHFPISTHTSRYDEVPYYRSRMIVSESLVE
jgi:hypothetical protein